MEFEANSIVSNQTAQALLTEANPCKTSGFSARREIMVHLNRERIMEEVARVHLKRMPSTAEAKSVEQTKSNALTARRRGTSLVIALSRRR